MCSSILEVEFIVVNDVVLDIIKYNIIPIDQISHLFVYFLSITSGAIK